MSRSQPKSTSPVSRRFRWSGSKGEVSYYDKLQGKDIPVKLPFEFMVLDQLATIAGFDEKNNSNYWSNEVRSVGKDELTVRTSKGVSEIGLYRDLEVRRWGAKYATSIYIAYKQDNEWLIGNFKASGAALSSWIEFSNSVNPEQGKVVLKGKQEAKKGATTYFTPVFERVDNADAEEGVALELDKQLQAYLDTYLSVAQHDRQKQDEEPMYGDEPPFTDADAPPNLD
jgi:hypothetical protein